jgi:hypothetical protein
MAAEFQALGTLVADADIGVETPAAREAIDRGMRASLLCTLFGVEREQWVWPFPAARRDDGAAARLLADLMSPLGGIARLGTLAGASDLDPMDPGPSHTVLAATLSACVIAQTMAQPADDDALHSAVLAGVEAAWRVRSALTGARPGVGFHSPGVFGTLAAAGAGARLLELDTNACVDALAIALTRASGLAINSAASMIGMTHFGWGAFHGLEAALLASQGWGASHDVGRGLATLFGAEHVDVQALAGPGTRAAEALVFKRYPCNIYLNLVVALLDGVPTGVDRIELTLPWVPHLDCAQPRDLRQARNSAQAVAAIAGAGDVSYAAFSGPAGPWRPKPRVARLLSRIELKMDKSAPTGLKNAVVTVRAWRGDRLVHDASGAMRDLKGWGVEHASRLIGPADPHHAVQALYGGSIMQGFGHVQARLEA